MLRIRVAVISAIAAFALTGLAQAVPASAHEYMLVSSPVAAYTGLKAESSHDIVTLKGTPFGVSFQVECGRMNTTGGVEAGGSSVLDLSLSNCVVVKPAKCQLPEINFNLKGKLGAEGADELSPDSGTSWATFALGGSECSIGGKPFEVTGTQTCSLPEAQTERVERELACKTSGSSLKMGGKLATLEGYVWGLHVVNGEGAPTNQTWSTT